MSKTSQKLKKAIHIEGCVISMASNTKTCTKRQVINVFQKSGLEGLHAVLGKEEGTRLDIFVHSMFQWEVNSNHCALEELGGLLCTQPEHT